MVDVKNALVSVSRWRREPSSITKVKEPWTQVGSSVDVYVYFQPTTPGLVFQKYGLELKSPAVLLCELDHADVFDPAVDSAGHMVQVLARGEVFYVASRPQRLESGEDTDHATVLLEYGRYPRSAS